MNDRIKIYIGEEENVEVRAGITPMELWEELEMSVPERPMVALVNHEAVSLGQPLWEDARLEYVGYDLDLGKRTFVRTLVLLVAKAARELDLPKQQGIKFEHAISNGYYCRWYGASEQQEQSQSPNGEVHRLKERVEKLVAQNLPIRNIQLPSDEAIEYFQEEGRASTAELISQLGKCFCPCVEVGGYLDFQLEPLLPLTGMVWNFDLIPYEQGFLIQVPNPEQPTELLPLVEQQKLFDAFRRHLALLEMLGLEDAAPINQYNLSGNTSEMIRISEALQERRMMQIAKEVAEQHESGVRIVLIAGPSSSGKTTFSKRLQTLLLTYMLRPFTLSLDDYFVNRAETPRDEEGEYDYESLYALDLPLLQQHLTALANGKEVELPVYNFVTGEREYHGRTMQLAPDNILIIEGIHALNPELSGSIPPSSLYKVYISALTTVSLDTHNWISTSDNRLLRRIVRDSKYRGTTASETIQRWSSVRRGEHKWIFPYQEVADVMFNSAMLYELGAIREQAETVLSQVRERDPSYTEASRLLRLLRMFAPLSYDYVPPTSLLREFLGGSSFDY